MYWYAVEAKIAVEEKAKTLNHYDTIQNFNQCTVPLVSEFLVRRVASIGSPDALKMLMALLAQPTTNAAEQKLILRNILAGLKGRRQVDKPAGWDNLTKGTNSNSLRLQDPEVRLLADSLGLVFGDAKAAQGYARHTHLY